ncbi:TniQ family protein [Pseudogemmobacter blasticus]|uniref:TniQ domain-containing protein n=1 Tax=Fuscovulum blasticum DSM 2131 TaxID=1188250 RepID=A0A2T4J9C6_FUSBL|nr:hypothetical protein C5F44_08765 [Fuscovulum blasticum DSM 2131]
MGLSWRRILQLEPEALQDLADLTGADPDDFAAHSCMPTGAGGFQFRGRDLPRAFLDRSTLKLCPRCVQADIVDHRRTGGRAEWQIDLLNVCPVHGVLFQALTLPDYPRCPHDFAGRMAEGALLVQAGPQAWRFARYLSDRLLRPSHGETSAWLDALPIDVAARLCENAGILMLHGPAAQLKALDREARVQANATGFAICANGPEALRDAYDGIRHQSSSDRGGSTPTSASIPAGCNACRSRTVTVRSSITSGPSCWRATLSRRGRRCWGSPAPSSAGSLGPIWGAGTG